MKDRIKFLKIMSVLMIILGVLEIIIMITKKVNLIVGALALIASGIFTQMTIRRKL